MKTDDRDEPLEAALEDAVTDLGRGPPDPGLLMLGGTSRRLAVLAAALLTVAVFIGAIGLAATQVGTEADGNIMRPRVRDVRVAGLPLDDAGARRLACVRDAISRRPSGYRPRTPHGLVTDSSGDLRGVQSVASELPPDVADSDVIVFVDPFIGTGAAEPTTLVLGAERDDDANVGWTWRDGKLCGKTGCARVYLWHGPDASRAAVETGLQVARGVRLVESRPNPRRSR